MYLLLKRKLQNITNKSYGILAILVFLVIWQLLCVFEVVPNFMLPSPIEVVQAFIEDIPLLIMHSKVTLLEAFLGIILGILLGFVMAVIMDQYDWLYKAMYPLLVITQTIPTVAIAPLLVLWLGYGITPKVVLIVIVTFFPIVVGLLEGFQSADKDTIRLLQSMGATRFQIFQHVKFKSSLGQFYSSLRISVSYSIVGAVISEWLGGFEGLGVYMTRVKKSFSFDKMFAVIFLISAISLCLMLLVEVCRRKTMPWEQRNQ